MFHGMDGRIHISDIEKLYFVLFMLLSRQSATWFRRLTLSSPRSCARSRRYCTACVRSHPLPSEVAAPTRGVRYSRGVLDTCCARRAVCNPHWMRYAVYAERLA